MRPRFVYEIQKLRDVLFNVLKLRVVHTLRNFSPHASDNGAQRAQDRDEIRSDVSDDLGLPLKFSDALGNRDALAHADELYRFWRSQIGVRRACL